VKKLFELVVRAKKLEHLNGCLILVTHISGDMMQAQGTNGISRGLFKERVSTGLDMLAFCPWHLSALEVSFNLQVWLEESIPWKLVFLEPEDWFCKGHDLNGGAPDTRGFWRNVITSGNFVWSPPPAAAQVALEQLRKARLKRQNSTHIIVIPKLMTTEWLKQMHKVANIVLEIPARHTFWGPQCHEPLMIAFVFPFLKHNPWQLRSTPKMFSMARKLRALFQEPNVAEWDILRNFLLEVGSFQTMSPDVVRAMLYFRPRTDFSNQDITRPPGLSNQLG
jgi:hypothetical protein